MNGHCDLHLHGAFGVEVTTASLPELDELARRLAARGTTEFLPTLVPLALPVLEPVVARLAEWISSRRANDGRGALPLGIHFEGPFVSPARAGALHPSCFADLSQSQARRILDVMFAAPGSHLITLAPEIPGGLELVAECAARGVLVSIGHTDATIDMLERAFAAGARHMTHFCNAMRPLHHREPGPIGFGLAHRDISVDLIADFHHVHPKMIELILRVKGPGKVALISDAIAATGCPDGDHSIWGETLTVGDGVVRNAAGALAGSIALLDQCVANVQSLGFSPAFANACAGDVPRAILAAASRAPRRDQPVT
jgi:N-acetylglucosamine-6-phosphate deacetylase